jgi:hypothetical protein
MLLLLLGLATVVGWQLPQGPWLLYPFTVLATYVHEMGHGLTAWALGGRFEQLWLYPDGSGVAFHRGQYGRLARAAIAGGGLVGPSFVGAGLMVASRTPRSARWILLGVALAMWLSLLLVVRTGFGFVFIAAWAAVLTAVVRFRPSASPFVLLLLAVQMSLSVFRDLDYMFSPGGTVDGVFRISDSAAMAKALFLPYWFWGGLTAAVALVVAGAGVWVAARPDGRSRVRRRKRTTAPT